MKDFIIKNSEKNKVNNKGKFFWISLFLFFVIWHIFSLWVARQYHPMILPSPYEVLQMMVELCFQEVFWYSILLTLYRGGVGFFLAFSIGVPFGFLMGMLPDVEAFFRPLLITIQTTPTVSWLALALIWFGSPGTMTIFITFIAVLPILIINVYQGIGQLDKSLLEMSTLFQVPKRKQLISLYLPQLLPFILAGSTAGIGMTWKAVAMAELLSGRNGIGGRIALARVHLSTAEVLAWTIVLMILGYGGEQLMKYITKKVMGHWRDA